MIGGIVSGLGSIVGGIIGANSAKRENSKNRDFQLDMLLRQQNFALETNRMNIRHQNDVNQENFDWNRESNVRKRIEEAGYNPYLYKDGATGSAQAANLDTGTSSLPSPSIQSPASYLSAIPGNVLGALSQFKTIQSQDVANDKQQYDFAKQQANDGVVSADGTSAYTAQGVKDAAEASIAANNAKITQVDAAFKRLDEQFAMDAATDENGQPMLDNNGQPITNYRAEKQAHLDTIRQGLEKLKKDIIATESLAELHKIETKIKTYFHTNTQPEELEKIKAEYRKILSDIDTNKAYQDNLRAGAAASRAAAALSTENAATTRAMRPYDVRLTSWQGKLAKEGALASQMQNDAQRAKSAAERDFNNSGLGKFVNGWASPTINGLVAPIIGGASNAMVGYGALQHGLSAKASRGGKRAKIGFR